MADELGNDAVRRAREIVDLVVWGGPIVNKFKRLVCVDIVCGYHFYQKFSRELGAKPMTRKAYNDLLCIDREEDPTNVLIHDILSKTTKDRLKKWVRERDIVFNPFSRTYHVKRVIPTSAS
jgi:hypothetical protein